MDVIVDEAIAPPPGGGRGRIVRIVKSGPANGTVGVNFTYTITITNTGSSDAMGITMSDPLPAGLSREDVTFTAGVTGCIGVVVINCTVAPLAPSASVSIFIEVMPTAAGNYTNIANLSVADPPESASNRQRTRVVLLMAPPNALRRITTRITSHLDLPPGDGSIQAQVTFNEFSSAVTDNSGRSTHEVPGRSGENRNVSMILRHKVSAFSELPLVFRGA